METMNLSDVVDLTQNLASTNLAYLGISVTIILFLGGFFYFLNIQPLGKKLETQEKLLLEFKNNIENKINIITALEKKSIETEKRIESVENRSLDQMLENVWTQHYVSQSSLNYGADILSLVWYLELTQIVKRGVVQMCLEQILRVLNEDPGNIPASVINMKNWNPDIVLTTFRRMISAFSTIEDFDDLKNKITNKAIRDWFKDLPIPPKTIQSHTSV